MRVLGIAELTLQAPDLPALERFYVEVIGLSVLSREDDRVWLAAGRDSRVGLWSPGAKEYGDRGGAHVHFALTVHPAALDELQERLIAHGAAHQGPIEHDGGDRSLYWTDPAGNLGEAWELFAGTGTVDDVASQPPSVDARPTLTVPAPDETSTTSP